MNFTTKQLNAQRCVPLRQFRLSPALAREVHRAAMPVIWQGSIFQYHLDGSRLVMSDERSLACQCESAVHRFTKGTFAFSNIAALVPVGEPEDTVEHELYELDTRTLTVIRKVQKGIELLDTDIFSDGFLISYQWQKVDKKDVAQLVRVNRLTGKVEWRFPSEISGRHLSATDSVVVLVGVHCEVAALNIHTGELLWKKAPLDFGILTEQEQNWWKERAGIAQNSLHIYKNQAIIGLPGRKLVALDINTGETIWHYRHDMSFIQTVVDWRGRLYSLSSEVYDAETGRVIDERPTLTIFDLNTQQILYRHELTTKTKKLAKLLGPCHQADVTETHYIGLTVYGLLIAVNLESGNIDWQHNCEGNSTHGVGLFVCNNRIYAQVLRGFDPHVLIFEGEGGYIPD